MSNTINLTIDGRAVSAPEGSNIIEAAAVAGIHIPNLCYLKGMKAIGACRLCLVQIEGQKGPMIACNTRIKEGMNVTTSTPAIEETRKFVIDLILSMHPLDCMTCTKAGVCNLQKYAYDFGIKESSFTRKKMGHGPDVSNPFIKRDPDYCLLCGRCVRTCKEQGTNVLEFMGRGVGSKVTTATDRPLQEAGCTFCGSCIDACPVNAILEADRDRKGREWDSEKVDSVCTLCGSACDLSVSTKDGNIMKINAGGEGPGKYICAYGRFGYDALNADSRITKPLRKVNEEMAEISWGDAYALASQALKNAGKDAGIISTASITNEDALAVKGLAKIIGTKNVGSTLSLYADESSMKLSASASLEEADVIVLAGIEPSQWKRVFPALDATLRRKAQRGAKLIVINSARPGISDMATVSLEGNEITTIKSLIKTLIKKGLKADKELAEAVSDAADGGEEMLKAAEAIEAGKEVLVLSSPGLFGPASNLALIKGSAVAVPFESNARGIAAIGLTKDFNEVADSNLKALLVTGEVPLKDRPKTDFLIVSASHMSSLARQADIVLPAASSLESAGSILDYMGKLKYLQQAAEPKVEAKANLEILMGLAEAMGSGIKKPTDSEVKKAVKTTQKQAIQPFEKKEYAASPEELMETLNASVINGSRILWLKDAMKEAAA